MSAMSSPRPVLFSDRGCPFAHRVLALLRHLEVPHDSHEARLGELPADLTRLSPSGRIPLLVHGEVVIGESRVILEHLAEAYGMEDAYPRLLAARTRARHAMALLDVFVAPTLTRAEAGLGEARLAECLDVLASVSEEAAPSPGLLAFHVAPIWLRLQWWHPEGPVTRAILRRPELAAWLDATTQLEAVARTTPDRAENVADFRTLAAMHAAPRRGA